MTGNSNGLLLVFLNTETKISTILCWKQTGVLFELQGNAIGTLSLPPIIPAKEGMGFYSYGVGGILEFREKGTDQKALNYEIYRYPIGPELIVHTVKPCNDGSLIVTLLSRDTNEMMVATVIMPDTPIKVPKKRPAGTQDLAGPQTKRR